MRIENVKGVKIVCGHIFPVNELKVGQVWASASNPTQKVCIMAIDDGEVTYSGDCQPTNTKEAFAFQCRYCLVVE